MVHRSTPARSGKASRVVTLWHAAPLNRVRSILATGLLTSLARGPREEIWLCSWGRRLWALHHVKERHQCKQVALIRVEVPRAWLTRRRRGLWTTQHTLTPEHFVAVQPLEFVG